jgi:hypothetical protein
MSGIFTSMDFALTSGHVTQAREAILRLHDSEHGAQRHLCWYFMLV